MSISTPSFTHTIQNPFKELRESKSLSHKDLAQKIGCTKQALIRLEQGMFDEPLPVVLEYYVEQGLSELQLSDQYEDFQQHTRYSYSGMFGSSLKYIIDSPIHLFEQLRAHSNTNVTETARRMCIPQSTLQRWENNWRQQKSVPKCVQKAMSQMGYSNVQINAFCQSYYTWRQIKSNLVGVPLVR